MLTAMTPTEVAAIGERLYDEKFRLGCEQTNWGDFIAIDVESEGSIVRPTSSSALEAAMRANPSGLFHLIRIGSQAAFQLRGRFHGSQNWLSR